MNNQRNANCIVQASQLNGGNLSQMFDIQSMRIIKGQAKLPLSIPQPTHIIQVNGVVGINKYDNSAIQLGPKDIIISCILENGNPEIPLVFPGNFSALLSRVTDPPVYNPATNTWEWTYGGSSGEGIIWPPVNIAQLNTGIKASLSVNTSGGTSSYIVLAINYDNNISFTSPNPLVNITLLVLTIN